MPNPNNRSTEARVHVRLPGAWGVVNDNAVDATGKAFITEGVMEDGTPCEYGWVRLVNRSTSGNLLFGPDSAGALTAIPPGGTQDVLSATNWIDVFIGVGGSLWLKSSTGTVRGTVMRL